MTVQQLTNSCKRTCVGLLAGQQPIQLKYNSTACDKLAKIAAFAWWHAGALRLKLRKLTGVPAYLNKWRTPEAPPQGVGDNEAKRPGAQARPQTTHHGGGGGGGPSPSKRGGAGDTMGWGGGGLRPVIIYIYIYTHTHTYTYTYTYIYIFLCICNMYIYIYTHIQVLEMCRRSLPCKCD